MSDGQRLRAVTCEIGPSVPARILLVPWGAVESRAGSFVVDDESAEMMLAAFVAQGVDLPIDYEHQSMGGDYAAPDGRAPAAGWVKAIEPVSGEGIYGAIEWTERGRQALAAKEYRYLSPVVLVEADTGRAIELHSAALTNKPAIVGFPALVNKRIGESTVQDMEVKPMDTEGLMAELKGLLKLGDDATPADYLAAIKAIFEKLAAYEVTPEEAAAVGTAIAEVAETELKGEGGEEVAEAAREGDAEKVAASFRLAINKLRGKTAGMVPAKEVSDLNGRIATLEKTLADGRFEAMLQAHSNKIAPAKRDWLRTWWDQDRQGAEQWLAEAPELVANRRSVPGTPAATGNSRHALILNTKQELEADVAKGRALVGSLRDAVSGLLIAHGQKRLTDEEAEKYAVV